MNRKDALKAMLLTAAAVASGDPVLSKEMEAEHKTKLYQKVKGNINHSVCRWCYNKIPLPELCREAKAMGIKAIDLLPVQDWKTVYDHGLECSMASPDVKLTDGFNDPKLHDALQREYNELIPKAAGQGIKNVICFSGNRRGVDDVAGLDNCAKGLEPLVKLAEKHGIILTMELLNSKVNHPDYQCDHTEWGVRLCKKIGSENFKLLYDIYHMQIMEGDIIATIRKNSNYISHYHTGGVPGRNEIDESQELYYPAIMKAIHETGFNGFVAQEFVPKAANPLLSLKEAIRICDV